jgi:hypothetical protein
MCAPRAFLPPEPRESGVDLTRAPAASEQHPAVHPEDTNFEQFAVHRAELLAYDRWCS